MGKEKEEIVMDALKPGVILAVHAEFCRPCKLHREVCVVFWRPASPAFAHNLPKANK
jgi:hypothetical protein